MDQDKSCSASGALTGTAVSSRALTLYAVLGVVRQLRSLERGHLAGLLHDGPMQDLAAITLQLGLPHDNDTSADILRQADRAGRELRRIQDELWPFPPPGHGLIETLQRQTAWLLRTPLAVSVGDGAAALPVTDVQAVAEVTELILTGLAVEGAWDRPVAVVRADEALIFLELAMTSASALDGPAAEAWLQRVSAVTQARARADLGQHRQRIRIEIPRCPAGWPDARTGHDREAS
jgi:hypothetical protein